MISGMYLGEMCRVTVTSPSVRQGFSAQFASELTSKLSERMSFPTATMSTIESDDSPTLEGVGKALAAAGLPSSTLRDRVLMREACVGISTRAAKVGPRTRRRANIYRTHGAMAAYGTRIPRSLGTCLVDLMAVATPFASSSNAPSLPASYAAFGNRRRGSA